MTTDQQDWLARLDDPDVVLGAHINAMRGYKRVTQAALGNVLGLSQGTMSKKLRGEVQVTFSELITLAGFFGVAVEDLIPPRYAGERVIGRGMGQAPTGSSGPDTELPRLDSNQQPSGYPFSLVRGSGEVVHLAAERAWRRAS